MSISSAVEGEAAGRGCNGAAQPFRIEGRGLVDSTLPLRFTFDGRELTGLAGDTLASALLANGIRLVGRSFKYHRPRGILSAGPEEPNALVELRSGARREPNTRATVIELYDALEATSQNRWPSLKCDVLSMSSLFSPILAAGFYYKTFMWPASFWEKLYEPLIRRAAGLGRAAVSEDPDHYEKSAVFCDVLVIGGGPAGLAAALAAGRSGARVVLCEEDFRLGGRLLAERREIDGRDAREWLALTLAELDSLPDVSIMLRTSVFGAYDHGIFGAVERVSDHMPVPAEHRPRQRGWRIMAKRAILAAGSIERPMVFGGNDRPGVMLAGATRAYVNRFGVQPGREAVVFTSSDDAYRTVADLFAGGVSVAAVVDTRPEVDPALADIARRHGARLELGGRIVDVQGGLATKSATILDSRGRSHSVRCDLVSMSNGWNPSVHLTCHQAGKPVWDGKIAAFVPGAKPSGMEVAGAAAGHLSLADALAGGARRGAEAAFACGFRTAGVEAVKTDPEFAAVSLLARVARSKGKAFVDFQNDVAEKDVELSWREGFSPVEHLKRYTTLGMATDQGKTSNISGLAIMAELTGRAIPEIGTTMFRPPYTPVAIGALAGHHRGRDYRPTRLTPSHGWARERGAIFADAAAWSRAQYFPRRGEESWLATVAREVTAVRTGVGVCDVSTLGKIDIQGVDAAEFLERIYVNAWKNLAVGKARYGVMLREDGFVMDDGTTSRLGAEHFLMTTTTANAARVMQHLQFCHQVLWPKLNVQMVSVTEQWAQYAIAGPRSRDVLREIVDRDYDISNEGFPYLAAAELTVGGGIEARLFRISFSGELAYELAVPAAYGDAAIRAITGAGTAHGICPYGVEALSVMRIEKGHVAGGELNGQTTAADLGLSRMMSSKKDFIGRAMASRPGLADPARPALVGFRPVNPAERLYSGSHFIRIGKPIAAEHDEGHMTSVAYSPTLGNWIGLGLLRGGPQRIGERVRAIDPLRESDVEVEICQSAFVDPEGVRLRV